MLGTVTVEPQTQRAVWLGLSDHGTPKTLRFSYSRVTDDDD